MEILLIVPKYTYNNLTKNASYQYAPPIGLAYISSVLKKEGYHVDCFNLNHLNGSVEDLVRHKLDSKKYDLVLSGHMGLGYLMIEKIIDCVHSHPSKPKVVIGGALITSEPELMANNLKFDFGIVGEGEVTIVELIKALEKKRSLDSVDGLIYRKDGKPVFTKTRMPIDNLDSLPFPDYDGLELDKQLDHMDSGILYHYFDFPRAYTLLGSRGCPFSCTFCYHTLGDKRYRVRSIKNITEEIRLAIKKYKINSFWLNDDMFASNKKRMYEFCKEMKKIIKETPWKFKWGCSAPVTAVDRETLLELKEAGCYFVGFGFESYSPTVLKSMKKPITPEQIDKTIKLCMELKMPIVGNFIFGDVAETKKTYHETLDYWKKNCKGQVQLHFIHPYPNSEIYQHCLKQGIIKDKLDYIKNHIHHTNLMNMTKMSDKDYKEMVREVLKAKAKYTKYVVPYKISKMRNGRYDLWVKCPFCKQKINYKNVFLKSKLFYSTYPACKNENCHSRFFICSRAYKLSNQYYTELDFLRKNYLNIRDNLLRKRV